VGGKEVEKSQEKAANPDAAACLNLAVPLVNTLTQLTAKEPALSNVLVLMNLFWPKELKDSADREDALADIRMEMERHGTIINCSLLFTFFVFMASFDSVYLLSMLLFFFCLFLNSFLILGTVTNIEIIQHHEEDAQLAKLEGPQMSELFQFGNCGFVHVTFSNPEEALQTQKAMAGRKFNGRCIVTMIKPLEE
jgi:hypothetical protein